MCLCVFLRWKRVNRVNTSKHSTNTVSPPCLPAVGWTKVGHITVSGWLMLAWQRGEAWWWWCCCWRWWTQFNFGADTVSERPDHKGQHMTRGESWVRVGPKTGPGNWVTFRENLTYNNNNYIYNKYNLLYFSVSFYFTLFLFLQTHWSILKFSAPLFTFRSVPSLNSENKRHNPCTTTNIKQTIKKDQSTTTKQLQRHSKGAYPRDATNQRRSTKHQRTHWRIKH